MTQLFIRMIILSISVFVFVSAGLGAEPAQSPKSGKAVAGETAKVEGQEAEESQIRLKVPLFSALFDNTPVALVNDEPILLDELKSALMGVHQQATGEKSGIKKDYIKVLNRLITTRLILAEATNMGLEDIPEIKDQVDAYKLDHLRDMLKIRQVQGLKPDEKVVESFYKEAVKEWKIRSLKFLKKEDAEALAKQVKAGGNFDALADKLIDSGKAEGSKKGEYVKPKALFEYVANVISTMKIGSVSQIIPIGPAFTIIRLEDIRYPKGDVQARAEAEKKALEIKRTEVLTRYNESLTKKYAVVDRALFKKLDFEAPKPGFNSLLKDKRVIVRIKGSQPITVADMSQAFAGRFFHGVDEAIKEKRVNELKEQMLQNLIYRVIFVDEAKRLGIDKSEQYQKDIKEFSDSLIFGQFVKMVIAPDIKVTDDDISAYYKTHIKDFTIPAMAKAQALLFKQKSSADEAVGKLRKGTDFDWIKNNAEGQVEKEKSEDLLEFSGKLISLNTMPAGIRETLQDAKEGDIKLYVSPEGYFYVLRVEKFVPATTSPLEKERKRIFNIMFAEKLNNTLDDWAGKLKKAYSVKIFMTEGNN